MIFNHLKLEPLAFRKENTKIDLFNQCAAFAQLLQYILHLPDLAALLKPACHK